MMKYRVVYIVILLASFLFLPSSTAGQSKMTGITVSPSIMNIDLADDPPEYTIQFTNNTTETIVLRLKAQDFTGLEDGWKVSFLEKRDADTYRYSLSSWISFNTSSLTLSPGEKAGVTVTVDADELSPGGHYAAVLAEIKEQNSANTISLKAALSSLLFVRTHTGKEREEAKISSITPLHTWFNFPEIFTFRFQNAGTVELVPHGTITITGPFDSMAAKNAINAESFITLPETVKRYTVQLTHRVPFLLPGVYKAKLDIHYGKSQKKIIYEHPFFSLGSITFPLIVIVILGVMSAVLIRKKFNPESVRKK